MSQIQFQNTDKGLGLLTKDSNKNLEFVLFEYQINDVYNVYLSFTIFFRGNYTYNIVIDIYFSKRYNIFLF